MKILLKLLQKEEKIQLRKEYSSTFSLGAKNAWCWLVIILAIISIVSVFAIPPANFPAAYLRNIFGTLLIVFLPGYAIIKAFFNNSISQFSEDKSTDIIARFIISLGVSLVTASIAGLILYYLSWLNYISITLCLFTITAISATITVLKEGIHARVK